jgi:3D (Asp-Asp-Asp) domain-containing protein
MAGTYYNAILRINAQTGTTYTLAIADFNADTITTMDNVSANTVTVPPSVFPVGAQLLVSQIGAGQTTIVAGSGVTLNAVGLKITAQYNAITMVQTATNVWYVFGNLTA